MMSAKRDRPEPASDQKPRLRDRWVSELEAKAVARFRERANLHANSMDWDLVVFAHGAGEDLPGAAEVRAAHAQAKALAKRGPGG